MRYKRMRSWLCVALALAALYALPPALAQQKCTLTKLASIKLDAPGIGVPVLTGRLEDSERRFVVDTGQGDSVYWTTEYTVVPFRSSVGRQLFVDVTLDGKSMSAMLDTGSTSTSISESGAALERLHLYVCYDQRRLFISAADAH
jgi:predicted aspartyl protease